MLTFTVTSNDLAERDIYAIAPVSSLTEFLKPHHSLCIVKAPYEGSIVEMKRIMGHDRRGEPMRVYADHCSECDQGYLKSKLDRYLLSPFLFISLKAKGFHTFRLVEQRKTLAEFPDFASALDAYFPEGFIPEKSYERKRTVFELMCHAIMRREHFREIDTILRKWLEKKREMERQEAS